MYSLVLLGLAAVRTVSAWGELGHYTVAYIAQNFVDDDTRAWAQTILRDTSDSYFANVAKFADDYRDDHRWSSSFHYIDAEDNVNHSPPRCYVSWPHDCGKKGCIVTAVSNYTSRVQDPELSEEEISLALKMLVHFLGDITQPLHTENYQIGGTRLNVKWKGNNQDLHGIWDSAMAQELRGTPDLEHAKPWADDLSREIAGGIYKDRAACWVTGLDINDATGSAVKMARDSNVLLCDIVMPNGGEALEDQDLFPEYYNAAIDTVELQIAKGGYRLAKWLDAIADAVKNHRSGNEITVQPHLGLRKRV